MKRFVFRAPGTARARYYKTAEGVLVPRDFLAIKKASRAERAANREARELAVSELERELADVLVAFRESITVEQATAAVFAGDARVIVNAAAPNELEAQLVAVIADSLEESVERGVGIGLRFAHPNFDRVPISLATEGALAAIEQQAATAVVGITERTQQGIRAILSLGVTDAIPPVEVARRIGDLAGLLPNQVRAVENFRRATFRRLVPVPEALTPHVQRVIDEEVSRYRDRLLLFRGRTIAETETQAAITAGERAFWDQAVAEGYAAAEDVFKTWRTVQDRDVCPHCEPLHGQIVPYGEVFFTGLGPKVGPPAHPRCRCYVEYAEQDQPARRRDRGLEAVTEAQNRRFLEESSLREELAVARNRVERKRRRLNLVRGTRSERPIARALEAAEATARTIEGRLLAMTQAAA